MAGYRIDRFDDRHLPALLRLEQLLWSPDPQVTAAHFDWKYRQNPYGDEVHAYLAFDGDEVVAVNGLYWSRWEHDDPGTTTTVLCRADTVIAPDHRGRGILRIFFETLRRDLADRGVPWLFGTSAGEPVTHAALTDGWQRCNPITTASRPPRRWWERPVRPVRGVERSRIGDSKGMAALIARLRYDGRIRHLRDAEYFAWRHRNPLSDFEFFTTAGGYLVMHGHADPRRRSATTIADWEAETDEDARNLLQSAVAAHPGETLEVPIDGMTKERLAIAARFGFTTPSGTGFRPAVIVRHTTAPAPWRMGKRDPADFEDWEWRAIYSDNL